jgi:hypothetical protein
MKIESEQQAKTILRNPNAIETDKQAARAYLHTVKGFAYNLINLIEDSAKQPAIV